MRMRLLFLRVFFNAADFVVNACEISVWVFVWMAKVKVYKIPNSKPFHFFAIIRNDKNGGVTVQVIAIVRRSLQDDVFSRG